VQHPWIEHRQKYQQYVWFGQTGRHIRFIGKTRSDLYSSRERDIGYVVEEDYDVDLSGIGKKRDRVHMVLAEKQSPVDVLVIEDNPGDVRLLEEAFRELKADIRMLVAKDGAEGVEVITRATLDNNGYWPDLILLDLNLPKVSGHDVLARIKENPDTRRIPVIVLTSSRAELDVKRAYDAHANAYLRKPSTLDGLIAAAEQIKHFWMDLATLPD
jgi:two-component system, chemotaxis family, response regulator Rcp1